MRHFFAIVSYDDFRPISYTGFSGDGTFALPAGTLALRPDSEFQDISEWSAMCEGSIEGYSGEGNFETVMVDGDIRLNISEQDPMSLPTLEEPFFILSAKVVKNMPLAMVPLKLLVKKVRPM